MTDREQARRDAPKVMQALNLLGAFSTRAREEAKTELRALLAELEQAERERDEAKKRLHLILDTIYTTHGYLDSDGEMDTAAKFRHIERLARIDWDGEGVSRVV